MNQNYTPALFAALQIGLDQLERGDAMEIHNEEEHHAFFAQLEARVLQRLADTK